jgi:NADPH:quinone reductase-like Zn-dependent oxidoreductase
MATFTTVQQPPAMAKAVIFDLSSKAFDLKSSYPIPTLNPAKNDHLIHVKTTALCAGELEWPITFPEAIFTENPDKVVIPGYDLAGTVITSPPNSPFHPGDEIYARTLPSRPGNCREYTIARSEEMAHKPRNLSWVDAATVPLSAITAWQVLFEHAGLKGLEDPHAKGKRVLVTAAAGGVGIWLIQLASIAGMEVVAQIGSSENEELVRGLGASKTVNYRTTSLKEWVDKEGPADIVADSVGGKTLEESWYCVKEGGALISIKEPPEGRKPEGLEKKDVKALFFIMKPKGQDLEQISKLLDAGKCTTVVDSVYPLEECEKAFQKLNGGHARGKIVIKVAE